MSHYANKVATDVILTAYNFLTTDLEHRLNWGNDSAKPATPSTGDRYIALDTKKVYYCYTAETWTEENCGVETIAVDDATPSVKVGKVFKTSANDNPTAITNFDDGVEGKVIIVIGGSDTDASTLASGTNLKLSGAMTLGLNDTIMLVLTGTTWIEISRTTWDGS